MPGVTIGRRCVIGAGSVVTKNIPDGCVAVGVPAEEYAKRCKNAMKPYDKTAYKADKKVYLLEWL